MKESTLRPTALSDKQYDFFSMQPHHCSPLAQDVETISAWMNLQPKAVFVIHSFGLGLTCSAREGIRALCAAGAKDDSLPLVAQMPKLEEFKLGSAQVTDAGLQSLAASKSLKKLSLSGLKSVTPAGIEQLRQARPELVIQVQ